MICIPAQKDKRFLSVVRFILSVIDALLMITRIIINNMSGRAKLAIKPVHHQKDVTVFFLKL